MFEQYEDRIRFRNNEKEEAFRSPYQDFRLYESSVTPGVRLGLNVIKPARAGRMLVQLHGWHMSMPRPQRREVPGDGPYVVVQVDMRGRAFSEGRPDCNGYELIDIYDAVQFVRAEYRDMLLSPELVFLEGGSGGGGNVLAAVAKFPDLFAAATALYGISDYAAWYEQDRTGEFRDDMDVWIGGRPAEAPECYAARSGIRLAANVRTPLYMAHGDGDVRVPVSHSRLYAEEMRRLGKGELVRYDEWRGVGGEGHLTGATEEQRLRIVEASERNRADHAVPVELPARGRLLVGGFLYTKRFRLHMETKDRFAVLDYDCDLMRAGLTASAPYRYWIEWADGRNRVEEGVCGVSAATVYAGNSS